MSDLGPYADINPEVAKQIRATELLGRILTEHRALPGIHWTVTHYALTGQPDNVLLSDDGQAAAWRAWVDALGLPEPKGERLFTVIGDWRGSGFNICLQVEPLGGAQ